MKILVVADEEESVLYENYQPRMMADVNLIIACGDLPAAYLDFLTSASNKPLYYVPGNHDQSYVSKPPAGCISLDEQVVSFHGLRIGGLGGSCRYKPGSFMYTEEEMAKRLKKLEKQVRRAGGIDVFVTHTPAAGYGDLEDLAHRGFTCFNTFMEEYHPRYLVHGHVHPSYDIHLQRQMVHPSGTVMLNCVGYVMLEIDDASIQKEPPKEKSLLERLWKR